jgi:hypothetical protein
VGVEEQGGRVGHLPLVDLDQPLLQDGDRRAEALAGLGQPGLGLGDLLGELRGALPAPRQDTRQLGLTLGRRRGASLCLPEGRGLRLDVHGEPLRLIAGARDPRLQGADVLRPHGRGPASQRTQPRDRRGRDATSETGVPFRLHPSRAYGVS